MEAVKRPRKKQKGDRNGISIGRAYRPPRGRFAPKKWMNDAGGGGCS